MEDCIFCKIAKGEIPSNLVLENENFYAFHDISPVAKVHVLVIPKGHITSLAHLTPENEHMMAGFLPFVRDVANALGLKENGYRLIFNTGESAGQTVPHLHAHILGGQTFGWPDTK